MSDDIDVEVVFLDDPEQVQRAEKVIVKAMQRIVDEASEVEADTA